MNKVRLITITDDTQGQRLDNYLITLLKGVPKSHIYRIIRKGEVRINKKRAKQVYKLQEGDIVRVPPVRVSESSDTPANINLNKIKSLEKCIIYESEGLIVLNKPSGLAVHGGSGLSFGAIEALRQLRPDARFLELVHRLDRDTSGCLLIAKKRSVLKYLHEQLRLKTLYKEYVALACGRWPDRTHRVDAPLLKNQLKSGERMVRVAQDGKPSITEFRVEKRFEKATLVKAMPVTGRTHQIRVHAQYVGCPLACDSKYGDETFDQWLNEEKKFKRLFLHARKLTFKESKDVPKMTIEAELDPALSQLLESLNEI